MLGILLLSDIHFAFDPDSKFDVDRELRQGVIRFLPTIAERIGDVGLIAVCGDIAYHGKGEEYATAAGFLRELRAELGDGSIPVKVVPGNHDIHQPYTSDADQDFWRSGVRRSGLSANERDGALTQLLTGSESGPGLLKPLEAYNNFASAYGCSISPDQVWWGDDFPITDGWRLHLRGLTSVLVSNGNDERDRLVLGAFQLIDLEPIPGQINATLCHHPYNWLLDGDEQRGRVQRRSQLHVTGHEHEYGVDPMPSHLHLRGGALQPHRNKTWDPRLNAIGLDITGPDDAPKLQVSILSGRWEPDRDSFVVDEERVETVALEQGPALPKAGSIPSSSRDVDRLIERLAILQFSDQLSVARDLGLKASDVLARPGHEIVSFVVDQAKNENQLPALWELVEGRHGGQQAGPNPFTRGGGA